METTLKDGCQGPSKLLAIGVDLPPSTVIELPVLDVLLLTTEENS